VIFNFEASLVPSGTLESEMRSHSAYFSGFGVIIVYRPRIGRGIN
jgi:hypothetical protein